MDTLTKQAIDACKRNDYETAKKLLSQAIKDNPNNETAWLWMTSVVSSEQEKIFCLQQVLKINPNNLHAKQGLLMLTGGGASPQKTAVRPTIKAERVKIEQSLAEKLRAQELALRYEDTPAYFVLLQEFLTPQEAEHFHKSSYWRGEFNKPLKQVIEDMLLERVLKKLGLDECLAHKFKVSELKEMLRRRGLPVSGRETELIDRLIQADRGGMEEVVMGFTLLRCSSLGREVVHQHRIRKARQESRLLFERDLSSYRAAGVTKVKVLTANDELVCDACRELASKEHNIDEVPKLPYKKCTSETCRCRINPIMDSRNPSFTSASPSSYTIDFLARPPKKWYRQTWLLYLAFFFCTPLWAIIVLYDDEQPISIKLTGGFILVLTFVICALWSEVSLSV